MFYLKSKPFFKIVFLQFAFFSSVIAQSNQVFSTKWIDENKGLLQATAKSFTKDDNGYLWIGTEMGLYRFDGEYVIPFESNKKTLVKGRIDHMGYNPDDSTFSFIKSPGKLIYTIKNNTIIRIEEAPKRPFYIFSQNKVYTKTNKILQKVFNNKDYVKNYMESKFWSSYRMFLIKEHFYVLTEIELLVFNEKGGLKKIPLNSEINQNILLIEDEIYMYNQSLMVVKNGKINKSKLKLGPRIYKILNTTTQFKQNNQFYYNNNQTFIKFENSIYKVVKNKTDIEVEYLFESPDNSISNIVYNANLDKYFLGTYTKGLAIINNNHLNTIYFSKPKYNNVVNSNYAVATLNDDVWYSSSGWFYNSKLAKAVEFKTMPSTNFWTLFPYKNKLLVNSTNGLLDVTTGEKAILNFESSNIPKRNYYYSCKFGNTTWANIDYSIVKIVNDKIIEIPELKDYFKNYVVKYLLCLNQNELIIATEKGVYKYHDKTKKVQIIKGLEKLYARYLKKDGSAFWVGTYGQGLYYVNNKVHQVRFKNPNNNTAHALEEDAKGNLWVSTNDGLLLLNKKSTLKNTLQNKFVEYYKFTTDDGLLTNEFNGGCYPASIKTKQGIIGFPSMKGYVWFDPAQIELKPFQDKIIIDKVWVNDKISNIYNNQVVVNSDQNKVEVLFSYPYFFNRENLTVSYRLASSKSWKNIDNNRIVLVRQNAGKEKLIIKVHSNGFDKKWDVTKELDIVFSPKFTETKWFIVLLVFASLLLIYGTYRFVDYYNFKKREYLKEVITQKTKQIESNRQELIVLNNELTNALKLKENLLSEIHHRVKNHLQFLTSMLGIQAKSKANTVEEFVQITNDRLNAIATIHEQLYEKQNSKELDLVTVLNNLTKTLVSLKGNTIQANVKSDSKVIIPTHLGVSVALIVNELISNTIKHQKGFNDQRIDINLSLKSNLLHIYYADYSDFDYQLITSHSKSGTKILLILLEQLKSRINKNTNQGIFEFYFLIS